MQALGGRLWRTPAEHCRYALLRYPASRNIMWCLIVLILCVIDRGASALDLSSWPIQQTATGQVERQSTMGRPHARQWILPILRNGPNNQKRDLRNALAMAKKFGTGIVLTGLIKHYREKLKRFQLDLDIDPRATQGLPQCFEDNPIEWGYMPYEDVLDRESVDAWVPSATVPELMEDGWDGELDAIVYPSGEPNGWVAVARYVNRTLKPVGVKVSHNAAHVVTPLTLKCNGSLMREIKEALKPYRYIGVTTVWMSHHIVPNLLKEDNVQPNEGTCRYAVFKSNRLLRRAPWIRQIGKRFVQQQFHGQPYLAVHVRPYNDKCLDEWRRVNSSDTSTLDTSLCSKEHQDLHLRLARCIKNTMQRNNLTQVYIMAHPAIQYMVREMLAKEDITNVHSLSTEQLIDFSGCLDTSTTFLSMVEEEIATQSTSFIGTTWSSITHSIAYERMGLNYTNNEYWEAMTC